MSVVAGSRGAQPSDIRGNEGTNLRFVRAIDVAAEVVSGRTSESGREGAALESRRVDYLTRERERERERDR